MSTPNYGFFLPTGEDSMSDVKKNITDSFKTIEPRNNITVIPSGGVLPQTGDYNIGDRIFRDDPRSGFASGLYPSVYILICKDPVWGWHWRPVQAVISPWVTIPATAINNVLFELHPTFKFQIALDSKGMCYWRGAIRSKVVGITPNSSMIIFNDVPVALRAGFDVLHSVVLSPATGTTGRPGYVGGRMGINADGSGSFRFFNSATVVQNIWFNGLMYPNSQRLYYAP
jgi:hypothetical protein